MKVEEKNMEHQILDAAEELFLEQGFAKTTTGQIAKLAGCNQALVHYYYRTKDNLFEKIFEEKVRMIVNNILTVNTSGMALEERIAQMVGLHFDFLMQNPKLVPFVFTEIISNPERLQSMVEKLHVYPHAIFEQLDAELKKEIALGNIRPIETIDLLITAVSLNVPPFVAFPLLQKAFNLPEAMVKETLERRKSEVIATVLARIKK